MAFKTRAVIVRVVVDETDDSGNVVAEHVTEPVKVFPAKFSSIAAQADALAERLTNETKA